jgi:hypothetical protein
VFLGSEKVTAIWERSFVSLPREVSVVRYALSCSGCCRTSWSLDGHDAAADMDLDVVWNDQLLLREDVLHLEQW